MKKQVPTSIITRLFGAAFFVSLLFLVIHVMPALGQDQINKKLSVVTDPPVAHVSVPDTLFNCTWTSSTVYPITILDNPVTTVGGFLYSFGGVSNTITAASNKFDGTTWTAIAPLPVPLEFPSAVNDGTFIYIMGGLEPAAGTPQTTVNRYDPVANTYTPRAPFTTGTWNHAAVYLNGKVYKFTGSGPGTASTNVTEIYDVATNTWTAGPAYPLAMSFVSGWTDGTFIYGAGGIQSVGSVASAKTYRLNPANLAAGWDDASIADLPATRFGAATAYYTDAVLAGGYVAGFATANISNTAIAYDIPSNTWQTLPNMVGERARMTGAVLNNSFYVVGGRSMASAGFVGTNSNQKLTCLNSPVLSAESRLVHGAQGPFNIALPNLPMGVTAGAGIECRRGAGANQDQYTIVVNFASPQTPASIAPVTVDCGVVDSVVQGANANQVLVQVSGACHTVTAPPQYIAIHGSILGVPFWVTWGHLYVDTNASGAVNTGDAVQTRNRSGQLADGTNFRSDVNTDGTIAAGDSIIVRSRSGTALP